MTGNDRAVARARLADAGLDEIALLEKPFEFEQLVKKLAELLPEAGAPTPTAVRASRPTPVATVVDNVVRALGGRVL